MNKLVDIRLRTAANIATLSKDFQLTAAKWVDNMRGMGVEPLIYEGFRTLERQAILYASGRDNDGKILTKARPGESKHNWGKAFDWVPMARVPKLGDAWTANWDDEQGYKVGLAGAEALGFQGIDFESGHLEMS